MWHEGQQVPNGTLRRLTTVSAWFHPGWTVERGGETQWLAIIIRVTA